MKKILTIVAALALLAGCSTTTRTGAAVASAACLAAPPSCLIVVPTAGLVVYTDEHGQRYPDLRWDAYVRHRGEALDWSLRDLRMLANTYSNADEAYQAYLRTRYAENPPEGVTVEDATVAVWLARHCRGRVPLRVLKAENGKK